MPKPTGTSRAGRCRAAILRAALGASVVVLCTASHAWAQVTDQQPAPGEREPGADRTEAANGIRNTDDVIVTGSRVNAETPITASVNTTEPQAIVSRSIIENSVPPTADFSDVVLLTPSASGYGNGNGPGLAESKTVLRGFQDGFFNVTYDGIPFGDSNNPTHHSTAYFPTGTYERIIVDRGPGTATDLGQASFGGNIHLISREATEKAGLEAQGVGGSYNTYLGRLTLQSGDIRQVGDLRIVAVGEYKRSDGALTNSGAWFANGFAKAELPVGSTAKVSLLSSYNQDFYHQSDNNGVSCTGSINFAGSETDGRNCLATSQVGLYGKGFGLTNVRAPEFANTPYPNARYDFNWTRKYTDFEVGRLQVDLTPTIKVDNKIYTYFYKNFTVSTQSSTIACLTNPTNALCSSTNAAGIKINGDLPGYTKLNQYRTWGDILQVDFTTPIGVLRVGTWYEYSKSHRSRYSYDLSAAYAGGGFGDGFFNFAKMTTYYDYGRNTSKLPYNVEANGQLVPGYIAYDERTGWEQIQGFGEFDIKLLNDRLTIVPGIKVQNFTRTITTGIAAQSSRASLFAQDSYKPTLPYATANFLLRSNWSFYFQFAKGFLIPQLSDSLEALVRTSTGALICSPAYSAPNPVPNPQAPTGVCNLQPTRTTNYQFGSVYAGERLNVDADVYLINASNSTAIDPSTGLTASSGLPAIYKGIEGQASYSIVRGLTAIVNGSLNIAQNDVAANHLSLVQSPAWTALAGAVYSIRNVKLSYLHKFIGRQFADAANLVRIAPYSQGTAEATIYFGPIGAGVAVYNLFDNTSTERIGSPTAATPLYFFQPGRSFQGQVRLRF